MPRLLCLFFFCHPELVEGSRNGEACAHAGDGSLRASCGLLALWAAQPLACAPRGREGAVSKQFNELR